MTQRLRWVRFQGMGLAVAVLLGCTACDGSLDPVDADADPCFEEPRGEFVYETCEGALTVTFLVDHRAQDIDSPGFRTRGYVSAIGWHNGGSTATCGPPLWESLAFQGPVTDVGAALGTVTVHFPADVEVWRGVEVDVLHRDSVDNVSMYLEPRAGEAACSARNQLVIDWFRYVDPRVSYERSREERWELTRTDE